MKGGIVLSDWNTPNTYDINFAPLPQASGVYLLVLRKITFIKGWRIRHEIVYVGSSINIANRLRFHQILNRIQKEITDSGTSVVCYFKTCSDYIALEKNLIKETQARYNKQWR
jgi:excinuclease UvrABC nuclease subunit